MRGHETRRRPLKMSPLMMTKAYLIWAHCQSRGWGQSFQSVADALGFPRQTVISIARGKGWIGRFRSETPNAIDVPLIGEDQEVSLEPQSAPRWA
ncbi:hypothetical protein SAMN05421774_10893 [Gemmobacter megaterium]|uniref:Helix-turn-helix domain-containing protein n=1 Tax=Gemmobacter megaterium TaxID=1086013 RepID=A0A1N7QBI7_9RHOB|nr:hypothetical protein [Gemmobacter megaterium]GGE24037.1 hypothetical protein GCM10011345_32520 [Gemmobacter megaterium]SIT20232.1 hypothetical protein SAMN05421774_10893 [Gemmobacter megaterium]